MCDNVLIRENGKCYTYCYHNNIMFVYRQEFIMLSQMYYIPTVQAIPAGRALPWRRPLLEGGH